MLTGLMISPQNPCILQKHTSPKSITFFGRGWVGGGYNSGRHHNSITITKKNLPRNVVTQFTLQLRHTKPTLLRRCGSVFTVTTSQTGQQVGVREEKLDIWQFIHNTNTENSGDTASARCEGGGFIYILKHFSSGLRGRLFEEPS